MLPLNEILTLPSGPLLFLGLALIVVGSSMPVFSIVVAAEPILMGVILATNDKLSIPFLLAVTIGAAVLGDSLSYWLGRALGPKLIKTTAMRRSRKHVCGAQSNVRRRGALGAMVIQRWAPPARGFVPALLGTGREPFGRFLGYSAIASTVWASIFILATHLGGRAFENRPKGGQMSLLRKTTNSAPGAADSDRFHS